MQKFCKILIFIGLSIYNQTYAQSQAIASLSEENIQNNICLNKLHNYFISLCFDKKNRNLELDKELFDYTVRTENLTLLKFFLELNDQSGAIVYADLKNLDFNYKNMNSLGHEFKLWDTTLDMISYLIEKDININIKNYWLLYLAKSLPLRNKSESFNIGLTKKLIEENKIKIQDFDNQGFSIIDYALEKNNLNFIKYLIDKVIDPSQLNGHILHTAIFYSNFDVIKYLIEEKKVNLKHHNYNDILICKPICDYTTLFNFLIKNGANTNFRDEYDNSLLHLAAEQGNLLAIQNLIEQKRFNVNDTNVDGQIPLHLAYMNLNHIYPRDNEHVMICQEIIDYLIKKGSNINKKDAWGIKPIESKMKSGGRARSESYRNEIENDTEIESDELTSNSSNDYSYDGSDESDGNIEIDFQSDVD